ncbi:hypothetical protein HAV15_003363 [Penicillium sp. str. |nr:hypothetical protein HAV15_003363 [Penicillium sp. str. \
MNSDHKRRFPTNVFHIWFHPTSNKRPHDTVLSVIRSYRKRRNSATRHIRIDLLVSKKHIHGIHVSLSNNTSKSRVSTPSLLVWVHGRHSKKKFHNLRMSIPRSACQSTDSIEGSGVSFQALNTDEALDNSQMPISSCCHQRHFPKSILGIRIYVPHAQ